MIKSNMNLFMIYPFMMNMLMVMIIMIPSKNKSHPLMLMFMLIFLTLIISIKMNYIYNSWMPFILFLAMIGGLMIIFMYITSLTNNDLLSQNFKLILINLIKISPIILLLMYLFYSNNMIMKINIQDSWFNNFMFNQINITNIYKDMNINSIYFLMLYIYYTMICIMNICYKLKIPLRKLMF